MPVNTAVNVVSKGIAFSFIFLIYILMEYGAKMYILSTTVSMANLNRTVSN